MIRTYSFQHSLADSRCCLLVPGEDYFRPEKLAKANREVLLSQRKSTVISVKLILDNMRS